MPNEFIARNGLRAQNSSDITGSLRVSGGITGSLQGTASYATQALSASYALSAEGGTVNSGTAAKLAYYASTGTAISNTSNLEYDGTNLQIVSTGQIGFYTDSGTIYFGNFSSPSYGRAGFSVPGASVMVIDYSTARAGFGGGTGLITGAPGGLVEIRGKANEIQLLIKGNGTQTANLTEWQNSGGSVLAYVDPSGNINGQNFKSNSSSGDEGGEIFLAQAQTNTTLAGGITIDSYQDKLRFFEQGGSARGAYIDIAACTAGVGTDIIGGLSDRRRKNNIIYLSNSYSTIIDSLKPVKFEFKENPGVIKHGFIAQDVLEIEPELVYGNGAEENGSYRIDYDGILAMTVKSLQEALARIDQLEKTIKDIQG
jgi:hypothetical protein